MALYIRANFVPDIINTLEINTIYLSRLIRPFTLIIIFSLLPNKSSFVTWSWWWTKLRFTQVIRSYLLFKVIGGITYSGWLNSWIKFLMGFSLSFFDACDYLIDFTGLSHFLLNNWLILFIQNFIWNIAISIDLLVHSIQNIASAFSE